MIDFIGGSGRSRVTARVARAFRCQGAWLCPRVTIAPSHFVMAFAPNPFELNENHAFAFYLEPYDSAVARLRALSGSGAAIEFAECSLRLKREAGEAEMFPQRTGLVHVSGVKVAHAPVSAMRDLHRVLVGNTYFVNNVGQMRQLLASCNQGDVFVRTFCPAGS